MDKIIPAQDRTLHKMAALDHSTSSVFGVGGNAVRDYHSSSTGSASDNSRKVVGSMPANVVCVS